MATVRNLAGASHAVDAPLVQESAIYGDLINPPADFAWPFNKYPVNIYRSKGGAQVSVEPRSLVNPAIWRSTTFIHVDSTTGNDATATVVSDPNDRSKPALSIGKAIELGNAAATPYRVFVKSGTFHRSTGFHGNGGVIFPTQPMSLEAWGGRCINAVWQSGIAWSVDATYTNCYTQARNNVLRVFDVINKNSYGDYVELTQAASAALCNSTPGTWFQNGANLLVRRADGAAVTDSNTRPLLGALPCLQLPASGSGDGLDMYVSGFDFEGGANGALYSTAGVVRNFVAEDCTFKYAGSVTTPIDGVQLLNMEGITAFFRCGVAANTKDGFNWHWSRGGTPAMYALTVDCWARDNGRGTSTSNNGHTIHDAMVAIDVNGEYKGNYGGSVHIVGGSSLWCVGTVCEDSLGDTSMGGTIPSSGFIAGLTTDVYVNKMWLDSTLVRGCLRAIWVNDPRSIIYTREHRSSGGMETANTGGTITTY